jgi:hypothetical protein
MTYRPTNVSMFYNYMLEQALDIDYRFENLSQHLGFEGVFSVVVYGLACTCAINQLLDVADINERLLRIHVWNVKFIVESCD